MLPRSSRTLGVFLLAFCSFAFCGCWFDGGDQTPPPATYAGFHVHTWFELDEGDIATFTPVGGIRVTGQYEGDIGTANGSMTPFDIYTPDEEPYIGDFYLYNRRLNAKWDSTVYWNYICPGYDQVSKLYNVTLLQSQPGITWTCTITQETVIDPPFWPIYEPPVGEAVQVPNLATAYGMPQMDLYDSNANFVSAATATSVAGTTATFPAPTVNGAPLGSGVYTFNVNNINSDGTVSPAGAGVGLIAVGANQSMTTPYGITAFDDTMWSSSCMSDSWYGTYCGGGQNSRPDYAVTLASPGQICFEGTCTNVGSEPTDLKTWGSGSGQTYYEDDGCNDVGSGEIQCSWQQSGWTGPGYAITTDYASNTATIVNLASGSVAATIPVGTNPMAVVLDSNQQNAYVANYGSGTISQINLAGYYVANTIYVGANPDALTLDPSGNSIWVGGLNYMANVQLSNLAVTNYWLQGQATSVGISQTQNSWICTTISGDLSTFQAQDAPLSNPWAVSVDVSAPTSGTYYAGSGDSTNPAPYLKASAGVTAAAGNGLAVTSTPTGFAVIDLVHHTIVFQGTTPSPVRGIAADPPQGIAYLTEPESNTMTIVPLPN